MPVSFTLPLFEGKPKAVKDMVFSILMTQFPLSLIELLNEIKRRYNISVSFQSVRKAALQLVEEKVFIKDGKKFEVSKDWILSISKLANLLQKEYFTAAGAKAKTKVEVGPNVTVYTFTRLLDMDAVWNSIIREHLALSHTPKLITFEAAHFWFVAVTLAQETELMKEMIERNVKLYYLCYGSTALDRWTVKHYNDIGVRSKSASMPKNFSLGHNIGVYGNLVVSTTHPKAIAEKMNNFFRKYPRIEDANLAEIFQIVTEPTEVKLTIVNDPLLAQTVRENVIGKFKH